MNKCNKCHRFASCTELCQEVEDYANQDHIQMKHINIGNNIYNIDSSDRYPIEYGTNKSNKRIVYELYFLEQMKTDQISYHVDISKRQIQNIIKKLKDSTVDDRYTFLQSKVLKSHFLDFNSLEDISYLYDANLRNIYDIINTYVYNINTMNE